MANIARPLPDPEIGLVLSRAINLAHIVFGPLIEQMLNLSLSDPVVLERFRDAAVDLLTRPLFTEAPDGSAPDGSPGPAAGTPAAGTPAAGSPAAGSPAAGSPAARSPGPGAGR